MALTFLRLTRLLVVLLAFVICVIGTYFYVQAAARDKARAIVQPLIIKDDPQATILAIAGWVGKNWTREYDSQHPRLVDWLALITEHKTILGSFRYIRGTIPVYFDMRDGMCSAWTQRMELLFNVAGYEANQTDIIGPKYAHSALSVLIGGKWLFLDPYLGVAFIKDGKLLSLDEAKNLIQRGSRVEDLLYRLNDNPDLRIYLELDKADFARFGELFWINIILPVDKKIVLGKTDGFSVDVNKEGTEKSLSTHLDYVGPKYGRTYKFRFNSESPETITFTLTELPDPDHLPRSNHPVTLDGTKLIYKTTPEQPFLELDYSDMNWNMARLLKRKNYYDVDMIEFGPTDNSASKHQP